MNPTLPADLNEAEDTMLNSILEGLKSNCSKRISVNLRFEGLRIMPVAARLATRLDNKNIQNVLIWPDAGATALAKNNYPDTAANIFSIGDFIKNQISDYDCLLIVVQPNHYDYEEYEKLCEKYNGKILMLNGKLLDSAVGIGSVGRERRRNFVNSWTNLYWIEPLQRGALLKNYPLDWHLFKQDPDGYRFVQQFIDKPLAEEIQEYL